MTTLLDKAFSKAAQLPEVQQDQLARIILDIIMDETNWDALFADPQRLLADMASEALTEYEAGNTKTCALDDP
ncbi:MAG: hypothetical protein BWY09_01330 [Candidatus Hydrogenedentes bacterium ADurb.Bin179]|nr:MAG: hypothetical protein BWY09_01330 [Candidatus Hydrogenedentes bacterium ADurb.Bin179]